MGATKKDEHNAYYTLNMRPLEKKKFIFVVKQKLLKKNMTISQLADAIHRPKQTVYNFFGGESKPLKFVAAEIANYFHLQRADWMWLTEEEINESKEKDKR